MSRMGSSALPGKNKHHTLFEQEESKRIIKCEPINIARLSAAKRYIVMGNVQFGNILVSHAVRGKESNI